jgi:hypothetical protein
MFILLRYYMALLVKDCQTALLDELETIKNNK